jgi:hypothetical protein
MWRNVHVVMVDMTSLSLAVCQIIIMKFATSHKDGRHVGWMISVCLLGPLRTQGPRVTL